MEKLIIENRTELSMADAVRCSEIIIDMGRISTSNGKKHYCHHATCSLEGIDKEVHVSAFRNKKSDRLVIHYNDGIDRNQS